MALRADAGTVSRGSGLMELSAGDSNCGSGLGQEKVQAGGITDGFRQVKLRTVRATGGMGNICMGHLVDDSIICSRGCDCWEWHASWCRVHINYDKWCHCIGAAGVAAKQISKTLSEI